MKLLMCRPDFFGIEYEINPWMHLNNQVNRQAAIAQWDTLHKTLKSCGADIELVVPISGLPDMIFTANAGLLFKDKIILARFKHEERQREVPYFETWFKAAGFELLNGLEKNENIYSFEGAGDALFAGEKLFAAYGFRSDRRFYEKVSYLKNQKLIFCELTNPYFYHLDTCFCPLNEELAIWNPHAFTVESQQRMSKEIELIPVLEEEAKYFACNAVVLNKKVVLPSRCPNISEELEKRGFSVYSCDMNEFLKSGGACKCLTLRID